jgi:hypothetical protein
MKRGSMPKASFQYRNILPLRNSHLMVPVNVIGKPMVDESERLAASRNVAQRLVSETGITEQEAVELIGFLGLNWSSLVREARLLPKLRPI